MENNKDLIIGQKMKSHLMKYAKWGKLLGIISYISALLSILIGLSFFFISSLSSFLPGMNGVVYSIMMSTMLFVYAILYLFIGKYLLSSAKQTKFGIETNNQVALEKGTDNLQKLFNLLGILTIIGLCLMALYFVFMGIVVALFAAM